MTNTNNPDTDEESESETEPTAETGAELQPPERLRVPKESDSNDSEETDEC